MSNSELINSIKAVKNESNNYLLQIFSHIIKYKGNIDKQEIDTIVEKITNCIEFNLNLLDNLAKIETLEKLANEFEEQCEYILKEIDHPNHTKFTEIIMKNAVSRIKNLVIDLKKGSEINNRARIKINQEVTLLLAFMKVMREEFTEAETISDYRLSQLVSDNFNNKDGKQIDLNYCKNKLSTGNGIAINDNTKLKTLLDNILKKIS